jgi:uroporphyrinogen-III synthase
MPSVLITRPAAMAEALSVILQKCGYETVCEPLLSIAPTHTPQPQTDKIDAIAITSSNALLALKERQCGITGLLDVPCFCVGPRTAESARTFGFRNVQNSTTDAVELAAYINVTIKPDATIIHIAGRDVTAALREGLEKNVHCLIEWPVYEAIPAKTISAGTRALLASRKLDAVVIFSPKTARVLHDLIDGTALEACCTALTAICLSEAVADGLRSLKWRRLIVASQPSEDAVIACLQEACPVQS